MLPNLSLLGVSSGNKNNPIQLGRGWQLQLMPHNAAVCFAPGDFLPLFHCHVWRWLGLRAGEPGRREQQTELIKPCQRSRCSRDVHRHGNCGQGCTEHNGYPKVGRRLGDPVPCPLSAFADTTPLSQALATASVLHSTPSQDRRTMEGRGLGEAEGSCSAKVQQMFPRVTGNAGGSQSRGQASSVPPGLLPAVHSRSQPHPIAILTKKGHWEQTWEHPQPRKSSAPVQASFF